MSKAMPFSNPHYRLAQIESIAYSERLGSSMFFVHAGLLSSAGLGAFVLFDAANIAWAVAVYCFVFSLEKWTALIVAGNGDASRYTLIMTLLFARAVVYNSLVVIVWFAGGDVFKFGAMALLVVATINIFVFHARYPTIIVCVVAPIGAGIAFLAVSLIAEDVWGPQSLAAALIFLGLIPYVFLTLRSAYEQASRFRETQEKLVRAHKKEALGLLVAGVAHDFNNILAVTLGNAEMLRHGSKANESEFVDEIIVSAERASSITRQLLSFAGKAHLMPEQLQLTEVTLNLGRMLRRILPETIEVKINIEGPLPDVWVDRHQLESALLNLAINSRDAMPEGGILTIAASEVELTDRERQSCVSPPKSRRLVRIAVSDTGLGVDEATIEKILDPFFTTKSGARGTGLGLSTVAGFAEQSGGGLQFRSTVGEGTTVIIFLPQAEKAPR